MNPKENVSVESSYARGYFDGTEDALEQAGSSAMLGIAILAAAASLFWFCVGFAIGWAM